MPIAHEWRTEDYTQAVNQIATPKEYLGNTHFKRRESLASVSSKIPIYRGNSIIMEAIASGAPRQNYADSSEHFVTANLARFAERKPITPSDLRHIRAIANKDAQEESYDALIGRRQAEIKNRFSATMEYLRIGAMMGKVVDGAGATLFEFKSEEAKHEFKSKNPTSVLDEISDKIAGEFGYAPGFMGYVSRGFFNKAWAYAEAQDLIANRVVHRENLSLGSGVEVSVINWNGVHLIPMTYAYKNKKGETKQFIPENQALFVPKDDDAFREFYTHAEHTKAMESAPQEYFSDVEDLAEGSGKVLIVESVKLPVCVRPYALRQAIWSN